ncbi:MAG TPA: hypothetical protein DCZ94_09035 [Lentisphaeria bacterium]|nr:MAG: hypothetical protein A2X48_23370 [Lentisphaerae bacterium GWF2_49_21]HBC87084.1 hypothetical protein [Lentisphaeria bacterium]
MAKPIERKLSKKAIARYVESGGKHCPYCGSRGIWGVGSAAIGAGVSAQETKCTDCGRSWDDILKLSGIYERHPG